MVRVWMGTVVGTGGWLTSVIARLNWLVMDVSPSDTAITKVRVDGPSVSAVDQERRLPTREAPGGAWSREKVSAGAREASCVATSGREKGVPSVTERSAMGGKTGRKGW